MIYVVTECPEFEKGVDTEPGSLIASDVQHDPHGPLLSLGRQTLVHRQVLVTLQVQQLAM